MELNFKKTIFIPLDNHEYIESLVQEEGDSWSEVSIQDVGKYLGFEIGPGRSDDAWEEAAGKLSKRVKDLGNEGIGLNFTALIYQVMCISCLSFLGQALTTPRVASTT